MVEQQRLQHVPVDLVCLGLEFWFVLRPEGTLMEGEVNQIHKYLQTLFCLVLQPASSLAHIAGHEAVVVVAKAERRLVEAVLGHSFEEDIEQVVADIRAASIVVEGIADSSSTGFLRSIANRRPELNLLVLNQLDCTSKFTFFRD